MKKLSLFLVLLFSTAIAFASFDANVLKSKNQSTQSVQAPVDINHADAKQLMTLKGVGAKKAQAIVAYREQHGAFKSVNDLSAVKGFSEKQLATVLKKNEGRLKV